MCFFYFLYLIGLGVPTTTETPDEDDDADWDDEDDSSEADDDGRVYKNPRNSPSTLCPRDEEQATLLGQKCLRKCSSDEDCKSKKKKCLCDGACGMSCIKPDRECPELTQPAVGTVTMDGRFFGSRAVYTCPHGSHVVGLHSRLCQADGKWAGSEPACKKNSNYSAKFSYNCREGDFYLCTFLVYCLTPPTIEHARHSALPEQTTFDLDSTVQYHCHTGYVTNGFPRAKCLAIDGKASWYGPDISCERKSNVINIIVVHFNKICIYISSTFMWPTNRSGSRMARWWMLYIWLPYNLSLWRGLRVGRETGALLSGGRFMVTERVANMCL